MKKRNELKFICHETQLRLIRSRISRLMSGDPHFPGGESYRIRSLYMDDLDNSFLKSVLHGDDDRFKFRLRAYNLDENFIRLERKWKKDFLTRKESCALSREECERTVLGPPRLPLPEDPAVLRHFLLLRNTALLRPVLLIEYFREAYVYPAGNVRITFDRWIASAPCSGIGGLFDASVPLAPLLPQDQHILEIKYDDLLPGFIAEAADIGSLESTSFSKYAMCRSPL